MAEPPVEPRPVLDKFTFNVHLLYNSVCRGEGMRVCTATIFFFWVAAECLRKTSGKLPGLVVYFSDRRYVDTE
jgi:hypothetical protein